MADQIRLSVNADELATRLSKTLPSLTRDEIFRGMRQIIGKLEAKVIQNIHTYFENDQIRPPHIRLEDGLLGTVVMQGDMIIGQLGIDLEAVPYAGILEHGGATPPHLIRPRKAGALGLRIDTFTKPLMLKEDVEAGYPYLAVQYVNHPGARIAARHFMQDAVTAMQQSIGGDLMAGWQRALMRTGF